MGLYESFLLKSIFCRPKYPKFDGYFRFTLTVGINSMVGLSNAIYKKCSDFRTFAFNSNMENGPPVV